MKLNTKTRNYLLLLTLTLLMTACGGGGGGSASNQCRIDIPDSDGDGFNDSIDIAPNDASLPGDFSTVEKILANTKVQKALQIAKEHGVAMRTETGTNPPNLTGVYKKENRVGSIVVTERGRIDGRYRYAFERKICTQGGWYKDAIVDFGNGTSDKKYGSVYNAKIRGEGKYFTVYIPRFFSCTKKDFADGFSIYSGRVNGDGDLVEYHFINVIIAYNNGNRNCSNDGAGKWRVDNMDTAKKVTNLDELTHMCVDGNKAYTARETWKNSEGKSCSCSSTHEVSCQ